MTDRRIETRLSPPKNIFSFLAAEVGREVRYRDGVGLALTDTFFCWPVLVFLTALSYRIFLLFKIFLTYSTYSKPVFQFLDETKQTNVSPF